MERPPWISNENIIEIQMTSENGIEKEQSQNNQKNGEPPHGICIYIW